MLLTREAGGRVRDGFDTTGGKYFIAPASLDFLAVKQARSVPVMRAVIDAVMERLWSGDEAEIRIPDICRATGVNYGSVYHHFGSREGVIDAAYHQLFRDLVRDDLDAIASIGERARDVGGYLELIRPLVSAMSAGEDRRRRRAMRARIVAASLVRPELGELIAVSQAEVHAVLTSLVAEGQVRGFLRRDVDSRALATVLQSVLFGRVIDDVSSEPVSQVIWEDTVTTLLGALVEPTPSS